MTIRARVLGVPVDCLSMEKALAMVDGFCRSARPRPATIFAVNPEKVLVALRNPEVLDHLESSDLLLPDGIGVVWAVRRKRACTLNRVPGCDLMQEICRVAPERNYRIFLYGASPEVSAQTEENLRERYPGIAIVGRAHGYLSAEQNADLVSQINDSGADILFVALGSPRQEAWMRQNLPALSVKVCQGVGGSFDVIAGKVRRAPAAFQRLHLEWAYRLLRQPSRVWRQLALLRFVWLCLSRRD